MWDFSTLVAQVSVTPASARISAVFPVFSNPWREPPKMRINPGNHGTFEIFGVMR